MAKTIRVHTLAKELGVSSKDILHKCKAEGIDVKNHMSAIKLGLAASIREWFSAGEDVTTVEVATPVDLDKVKKPRRPRKPKTQKPAKPTEEALEETKPETLAATEAPAATEIEPPKPVAPDEVALPAADEPAQDEPSEPIEEPLPATLEKAASAEKPVEAPPEPAEPAEPEPAKPPEPVRPAGPQVVPKPAELRGPRVVRIEQPDRIVRPRPRPSGGPVPLTGISGIEADRAAPTRPRKGKREEQPTEAPVRSRSPRRQVRYSEVSERLKEWRDQDVLERKERLASATGLGLRARRSAERRRQAASTAPTMPRKSEVEVTVPLALKDFCAAVGSPYSIVSRRLMEQTGSLYRINDRLDAEVAELLAMDLGVTLKIKRERTAYQELERSFEELDRQNLQLRPPVVTMLGHVDHGKTSLLDAIRRTNVVAGEAGGITQHVGAYRVDRNDWHVTFIDTPGHEAFTAMRARGAHLTDVVVLVVAADDGVMPQTIEAINHARAANVPIVVALNKIDLPNVDLNRIYAQLSEHELVPTEWGGQTDVVKTSATTGQGIDELIEHLSTLSELLELRADSNIPARATVIDAQMQEGRGVVAQVLVREGTLKPGQCVVCGPGAGRIRLLLDDRGKPVKAAAPGTPVQLLGLDELPGTGDPLYVVKSLSQAKKVAQEVQAQRRAETLHEVRKPPTLEELLTGPQEGEVPELNLILKADNQGTLEAVISKLREFPDKKARLRVLHSGVGAISEADVNLAQASNALIIGFHVVAEDHAAKLAERGGVEIRTYRVIYELLQDVTRALEGLLAPVKTQELRAKVEVREVFHISRVGRVAGCYVTDGAVNRSHRLRLVRDGRIVLDDAGIDSLRRFKEDVREVRAGLECGIKIDGYDDVKPGDVLEAYEVVEVAADL